MKWKLVIFDLDGTLVDTIEDLGNAVNFALASKGLPQHDIPLYRNMVGNGVRNLMWRAMPESLREDAGLHGELLSVFLEYYSSHIDVCSVPYPGVPELLSALVGRGVRVAVASNKFQEGTDRIVGRFFGDIGFSAVLGGRDGIPLKPDPAVVREILSSCGMDAGDAVMVGDSATDMLTAKAAGIPGIAVTWGFRPAEASSECDYMAGDAGELGGLLL